MLAAEVSDLVSNSGRLQIKGCGTATAALGVGGDSAGAPTTAVTSVEVWDGSSWTETNDINTARFGMGIVGTTTATLGFGGYTASDTVSALCELYDGSSWTETTNIGSARYIMGAAGTSSLGLAAGGGDVGTGISIATTEEFQMTYDNLNARNTTTAMMK